MTWFLLHAVVLRSDAKKWVGKRACFQMIRDRFGPDVTYVAIGDEREEEVASAEVGIKSDLKSFFFFFC